MAKLSTSPQSMLEWELEGNVLWDLDLEKCVWSKDGKQTGEDGVGMGGWVNVGQGRGASDFSIHRPELFFRLSSLWDMTHPRTGDTHTTH